MSLTETAPKPLLTPDEFHKAMLGTIGRGAVYEFVRQGKIRRIRVGKRFLIPRTELEDFPRREAQGKAA